MDRRDVRLALEDVLRDEAFASLTEDQKDRLRRALDDRVFLREVDAIGNAAQFDRIRGSTANRWDLDPFTRMDEIRIYFAPRERAQAPVAVPVVVVRFVPVFRVLGRHVAERPRVAARCRRPVRSRPGMRGKARAWRSARVESELTVATVGLEGCGGEGVPATSRSVAAARKAVDELSNRVMEKYLDALREKQRTA